MVRSRLPNSPMIGPEINFGNAGYTFPSSSDVYELEIHFIQPFTVKYIVIPNRSNIETFKVEASHAGMLAVFGAKATADGLVVDGFPAMLISMLVIRFTQTIDGQPPRGITLNIVRTSSAKSQERIHDSILILLGFMQSDLFAIECKDRYQWLRITGHSFPFPIGRQHD